MRHLERETQRAGGLRARVRLGARERVLVPALQSARDTMCAHNVDARLSQRAMHDPRAPPPRKGQNRQT
eukprot:3553686-Pleurochrysis_carterae.AAC.1